ncbi:Nn.00g013200.m01.CDS01 [Neocucurbitaria sp. VM-36]
MGRIASVLAAGLVASAATAFPASNQWARQTSSNISMIYSFEDVPLSADLEWTACYDRFHCANLEVPLDYEDPDLGTTVIAFIRQEAANSTGQDILFNPGGPGGSGVNYILSGGGDNLIKLGGGTYNVVSFDPRGVNNSGIALTCFPENPDARDAYYASMRTELPTLNEQYYQAVALGQWCTETNNGTYARYASTSAVVQDMVHFTELQAALNGDEKPEESLIWYYGVSYGTVIGHTLAALYPERVGRIIVDSNVNSENYYNGLTKTSVETADAGYERFFELCFEAGLEKCAFAGKSGSADDIKKRFDDLLAKLEKAPVIANDTSKGPQIITKSRVLGVGFSALYSPVSSFPYLAAGLAFLEKDNATGWIVVESTLNEPADPGPFNYTNIASQEVLTFVTGVDAAGRYPIKNVDDYIKVAGEIEKESVYAGKSYVATNVLINSGVKISPPKSQYFAGFNQTKTKTPIFFINNAADPITPLSSAKHMSQYFEGSVVLEQNSGGHSFASVHSSCTYGHVVDYLNDATLPQEGTVCETDIKPLVDSPEVKKRELPVVHMHLRR